MKLRRQLSARGSSAKMASDDGGQRRKRVESTTHKIMAGNCHCQYGSLLFCSANKRGANPVPKAPRAIMYCAGTREAMMATMTCERGELELEEEG